MQSIWGTGPTDVWAVGGGGASILHYDGTQWSEADVNPPGRLNGVWGTSATDVWAFGQDAALGGRILHRTTAVPSAFGGACRAPIAIYCESSLRGAVAATSPAAFDRHGCAGKDTVGGEAYYRLDNPVTGSLTVRLSALRNDLDLIVTGADGRSGCDPAGKCIAASQNDGTTAEEITLQVTQGQTLYFIVDGRATTTSSFSIEVDCTKE